MIEIMHNESIMHKLPCLFPVIFTKLPWQNSKRLKNVQFVPRFKAETHCAMWQLPMAFDGFQNLDFIEWKYP